MHECVTYVSGINRYLCLENHTAVHSQGTQGIFAAAWFAELGTCATRDLASSPSPVLFAGIGNRIPLSDSAGAASTAVVRPVSHL